MLCPCFLHLSSKSYRLAWK
uniref:Uncharacterized protein n=1 Tax=Rhizophora mucronata TaxID=61149 RepID=A0A2P2QI36_RHIMU